MNVCFPTCTYWSLLEIVNKIKITETLIMALEIVFVLEALCTVFE